MFLPFNQNTDANNQGNVNSGAKYGDPQLDPWTIRENNNKGLFTLDDRARMVSEAVKIRTFVRVKVSDDADLEFLKENCQQMI